jgi:hypothetical protein
MQFLKVISKRIHQASQEQLHPKAPKVDIKAKKEVVKTY